MEELRSTDILDKEIQNDAIKKAKEIVAAGEAEAAKLLSEVDSRIESAKAERQKTYEAKEESYKKDLEISVPLEKQRFLVSFITSSVNEALNDYLKKLPSEKRLELLLTPLDHSPDFATGKRFSAQVYGFDARSARIKIEKKLGRRLVLCKDIDASLSGEEPMEGIDLHEGIILEAEDGSLKFRLTLQEIISEVKEKSLKELVDALFGGRL